MGDPTVYAHKSAHHILHSKNIKIALHRRFADAAGIPLEELVPGQRKGKN
jgi:hypothetical protein